MYSRSSAGGAFSHPDIALRSKTPSFPVGNVFCLPPHFSHQTIPIPGEGQMAQLFPAALQNSRECSQPFPAGSSCPRTNRKGLWIPFPGASARGGEILPHVYSF